MRHVRDWWRPGETVLNNRDPRACRLSSILERRLIASVDLRAMSAGPRLRDIEPASTGKFKCRESRDGIEYTLETRRIVITLFMIRWKIMTVNFHAFMENLTRWLLCESNTIHTTFVQRAESYLLRAKIFSCVAW